MFEPRSEEDSDFDSSDLDDGTDAQNGLRTEKRSICALLRKHSAPRLAIWQLEHPKLTRISLWLKLVFAAGALLFFTLRAGHLYLFKLMSEVAGISRLTLNIFLAVNFLWISTHGMINWYLMQEFLSEDVLAAQGGRISSLRELLRALPPDTTISPSLNLVQKMLIWTSIIIASIVSMDMTLGSTLAEALQYVFTKEPLLVLIAVNYRELHSEMGVMQSIVIMSGSCGLVAEYATVLQSRKFDWQTLTLKHQAMDSLLEHAWYDLFGWAIIYSAGFYAAIAFSAALLLLAATSPIVKAAAAMCICSSLFVIGKGAFACAKCTEMCMKGSPGTIDGRKSILRIAVEMFGRVDEKEREFHCNFVRYLESAQCGAELPLLGLITFSMVTSYSAQVITVVPTGLAIALAVLEPRG